jgi:NnrS protein
MSKRAKRICDRKTTRRFPSAAHRKRAAHRGGATYDAFGALGRRWHIQRPPGICSTRRLRLRAARVSAFGRRGFRLCSSKRRYSRLTAGAIGMMTLAVMTRASLGHTGRVLVASAFTQTIYAAAFTAAIIRICAALEPRWSLTLSIVAGLAWTAALSRPMRISVQISASPPVSWRFATRPPSATCRCP